MNQKSKSHIRIAVFTILAIHIVLLGALLLQGCKRTSEPGPEESGELTNQFTMWQPPPLPPVETLTQQVAELPPPTLPPPLPPAEALAPPVLPTDPAIPEPPVPQPGPVQVEPPPPAIPSGTEHVIAKGDSFYLLAQKYGVTVKAIADANPSIDPRRLQIGKTVYIPAPGPSASDLNASAAASNGLVRYTVKSGDTLTHIARLHKTTVQALRNANNLPNDRIVVGQKLIIPKSGNP